MHRSRFLLLLSALLLAAGCGKRDTQTVTTAAGDKVAVSNQGDKGRMEITSKSGEKTVINVSSSGVELPADFPKDLPLYPKRVVQLANQMGKDMIIVGVQAAAPLPDVVKFYEEELVKQGWKLDSATKMGEGHMIMTSKAPWGCMIMIAPGKDSGNPDGTYVQLTLQLKQD